MSVTTYQGGKQRLASKIIDIIQPTGKFYDLCCGSGAISIELINRGYSPGEIHMLDRSPWGWFWKLVGNGEFDVDKFASVCNLVPKNKSDIKSHMQHLFNQPAKDVYSFLLLQASTFGGAAVWIKDNRWHKSGGFRNYWLPTSTSSRRSPVNPMAPMPESLLARVKDICHKMRGIIGYYADINTVYPEGAIYIDPPYQQSAFYGYDFNVL